MPQQISRDQLRTIIETGEFPDGVPADTSEATLGQVRTWIFYAAVELAHSEPPIRNEEGRPVRNALGVAALARPALNAAIERISNPQADV